MPSRDAGHKGHIPYARRQWEASTVLSFIFV